MHFLSTLFAASFIALVHTLPYSPNDALTYFEYDDPYPSDAYDNIDTFLEGTLPMPDYYVAEPSSTSNGAENLCKKNKKKLTCCDGVSLTEYDVSKCDYCRAISFSNSCLFRNTDPGMQITQE